MAVPTARADFGIDRPTLVFGLVAVTFVATFAGIFGGSGTSNAVVGLPFWIGATVTGVAALLMVASSRWGKRRTWTAILDGLGLDGDEQALDLGCGRGLVLVEVARRLPDGHVTGIDVWRSADQSGNQRAVTELNARITGVADRVTVLDGDMASVPLPDGSVHLVTAGLSLGRVQPADRRTTALREASRVLRPGGRLVVLDGAGRAIADELRATGWTDVHVERRSGVFPPVRLVTARTAATPS